MKKIISLLLVVCMLAACCTAFAAELTTEQKADALFLMGIFKGTDKGYELDNMTTREQGVTMIVRVLGKETDANSGKYTCKFPDVYEWAKGNVGFAFDNGITKGMSDTEFGYGVALTDAMFLTMLLRVLGYTEGESADFVWNNPYELAKKTGLVPEATADADFTRGDMVEIIYRGLAANFKEKQQTLAAKLIADGVFTQKAYDLGQQVAAGTTTLEAAQAALNTTPGNGGEVGGGTIVTPPGDNNFTPPADPNPGIGGPTEVPGENTTEEDHETPSVGPDDLGWA